MAWKIVTVVVCDAGNVVARLKRRPIRLMPDGHAGVVYQGAVYPLYRGNSIEMEDHPVAKEDCTDFLSREERTPYAQKKMIEDPVPVDLAIGDWYLESNKFGHYLVFDSTRATAEQLAKAVDEVGLGVKRWDESTRAADNGKFYAWFIRLEFDGTRAECLQVVTLLLDGDSSGNTKLAQLVEEDPEFDSDSDPLEQLADVIVAVSDGSVERQDVVDYLTFFGAGNDRHRGYLAWRLRDVLTRYGNVRAGTVIGQVQAMRSIVRDDKELLARLKLQHGQFFEARPHVAQRALDMELDKVDLDADWRSPDDALRRARASLAFLRHAVVLAFGTEAYDGGLQPLLDRLIPPPEMPVRDAPPDMAAAIGNLRRMITLVEELFSGDADELATLYADGRAELLALEDGDFDFLADLPAEYLEPSALLVSEDLSFAVLPPGELVQSFVDELHRSGGYHGRTVDLRRTRVLLDLAKYFQERRCTLHRGAFSSPEKDNGYVVLRLPVSGGAGEDAVAISPWEGEHATFVVRHGCGKRQPWPAVLSRTKREATALGARRLRFRVDLNHEIDKYEAMLSKIIAMLECERDEFDHGELYFDYGLNQYQMREPFGDYDGNSGASSRGASTRRTAQTSVFQRIAGWLGSW